MTVAMSNTEIRKHISAPSPALTKIGADPVPEDKKEELEEVLTWVFGNEETDKKVQDSREMSKLGRVIKSPRGIAALRGDASLEEAHDIAKDEGMDPRKRLLARLNASVNAMSSATEDLSDFAEDEDVKTLIETIIDLADSLENTVENS